MNLDIIRYTVLLLILWSIPAFMLKYVGSDIATLTSYGTTLGLLAYFIFSRQGHRPIVPFVLLGLLYFSISALNYSELYEDQFITYQFIRFMIVVVCGASLLRRTTDKELYYIILIGAATVIINAVFLPFMQPERFGANFGRFSGFYLNPNLAGGVCLLGYALSFGIKNKTWKIIGQITFTMAGILTLSRTFIVIWLIINFISIINNRKNIVAPALGALALIMIFTFSDKLTLNTERFGALQAALGQKKGSVQVVGHDTRNDVWAYYYDLIYEKPFIGHGYLKFQKKGIGLPGVHNSFLMVIGEAGIVPFLLLIGIYAYLLIKSYRYFRSHPWYFYITIVLILTMMGGHGYFYNFITVFMSMFVYVRLEKLSELQPLERGLISTAD